MKLTATEALALIARSTFSPMDEADYEAFAGVEQENCLMAETDEFIIILDGSVAQFLEIDGGDVYNFSFSA
jgi:hypothetical protein